MPPKTEKVEKAVKTASKRRISLEKFLERYVDREDPFKYEWNNGLVEKSPRTIDRDQTKLVQVLLRLFDKTDAYKKMGQLLIEVDMFLPNAQRTRRADMAYFPPE